jgi:hypothetical protein
MIVGGCHEPAPESDQVDGGADEHPEERGLQQEAVRREKLDQALSQLRHVENFWKNTLRVY